MTRRVLLGTGAVVAGGAAFIGGAQLTGRFDDVAEALGIDPKPEADPRDTRLLRRAATSVAGLVALLEATASRHPSLALAPFVDVAREQAAAVGGRVTGSGAAAPESPDQAVRALEAAFDAARADRAADAGRAVSPDLARVLASMSAGHAQCGRAVRRLR